MRNGIPVRGRFLLLNQLFLPVAEVVRKNNH